MEKTVVLHFAKGPVLRGTTADFHPSKPGFHVTAPDGRVVHVPVRVLKAVFFVRDLRGDPSHHDAPGFGQGYGLRTRVRFADGEVMEGRVERLNRDVEGFFLEPGDPTSNNERVYCVFAAIAHIDVQSHPTGTLPSQPLGEGSAPQRTVTGTMPAQRTVTGTMPAQRTVTGTMPAQRTVTGTMPAQRRVTGSTPAQGSADETREPPSSGR